MRWRFPGEDEKHGGVIEEVAGPGYGELLRAGDFESDGLALAYGADAEPPRFDVDALVPEAGFSGGDGDGDGAGDVEIDEVVAGCGVGYIDGLVINRNGEGGGAKFRRDGDGLNARGGKDHAGEHEHSRENHTMSAQEARPCKQSEN